MSASTSADTLEDEVEDYLAAPTTYAGIIEFWQVGKNRPWCWGVLIVVELTGAPEEVANTLQACYGLNSHSSHFSSMWTCIFVKQGDS